MKKLYCNRLPILLLIAILLFSVTSCQKKVETTSQPGNYAPMIIVEDTPQSIYSSAQTRFVHAGNRQIEAVYQLQLEAADSSLPPLQWTKQLEEKVYGWEFYQSFTQDEISSCISYVDGYMYNQYMDEKVKAAMSQGEFSQLMESLQAGSLNPLPAIAEGCEGQMTSDEENEGKILHFTLTEAELPAFIGDARALLDLGEELKSAQIIEGSHIVTLNKDGYVVKAETCFTVTAVYGETTYEGELRSDLTVIYGQSVITPPADADSYVDITGQI